MLNRFLENLERKISGRAVPRLTAVMIGCFIVGYIMQMISPLAVSAMSLNIHAVLRGQIWRIVTWVVIPPDSLGLLTFIMLFFYFSIGTSLEQSWGDAKYNIYLLGGILISLIAAFITYFVMSAFYPAAAVGGVIGQYFTTYNICMSLLLAFAATYPNATVLLMFVIPLKMKYLGWLYGAYIAYDCIQYIRGAITYKNGMYIIPIIAIAASLVNFLIFFVGAGPRIHMTADQRRRQKEFRRAVNRPPGRSAGAGPVPVPPQSVRHRCTVCGITDRDRPDLEFRYCSKCAGEHEYCMDHLYTHTHIRPAGEDPFTAQ